MAYSFLVFDFGTNEDVAQQARHRIDGWKQGFRLDKKLQLKFERKMREAKVDGSKRKSKSGAETGQDSDSDGATSDVRMIIRLDFSDHEKLSHQRWLDRIPSEEPFKAAKPKIIRTGDREFETTSELFDSLD